PQRTFFFAMLGPGQMSLRLAAKTRCFFLFTALTVVAAAVPALAGHGFNRGNWPFRPLERPAAPAAAPTDSIANPIDQFILHELQKQGLSPNRPADKATLLRRVTFDLIGLPPTPQELQDFLADDSPQAYERVVDRLL